MVHLIYANVTYDDILLKVISGPESGLCTSIEWGMD